MPIVFISGKMTGEQNMNRKVFEKAEALLRKRGYVVLSPAWLPDGMEYDQYIRICNAMINECDAVYMLRGWENSNGARLEYMYANERGKAVWFEEPLDEKMYWV